MVHGLKTSKKVVQKQIKQQLTAEFSSMSGFALCRSREVKGARIRRKYATGAAALEKKQ